MPKYSVTLQLFQTVIVEADNPEEAENVATFLDQEVWDKTELETDGDMYVEVYEGDKPPVNGEVK